jgi:hypothetical protein
MCWGYAPPTLLKVLRTFDAGAERCNIGMSYRYALRGDGTNISKEGFLMNIYRFRYAERAQLLSRSQSFQVTVSLF